MDLRRLVSPLVLCISIAACSGGSGSPIAIGDFGSAFAAAECELAVSCGIFPDQATCVSTGNPPTLTNEIAAVNAGKATYDAAAAGACISAFGGASCNAISINQAEASCIAVFTGSGAPGAPCGLDEECTAGGCNLQCSTDTACCAGTCDSPAAAIGQSCVHTAGCVKGAFCDSTAQICTALVGSGSACVENIACADGLTCAATASGSGDTCRPLVADGAACGSASTCAELGDACNSQTQTCARGGSVGATCVEPRDCAIWLTCGAAGKCVTSPTLGQPCTGQCSDGSFCSPDTSVCTALLPNGAACDAFEACQSDYCDFATGADVCADEPVCI